MSQTDDTPTMTYPELRAGRRQTMRPLDLEELELERRALEYQAHQAFRRRASVVLLSLSLAFLLAALLGAIFRTTA